MSELEDWIFREIMPYAQLLEFGGFTVETYYDSNGNCWKVVLKGYSFTSEGQ